MAACTYVNHLIAVDGPVNSAFYAGLGDRHQQVVDGVITNYTLDLAAGLTQVLDDGTNTYLYGNGRIAQAGSTTEYFLGDALGSVHQLADPAGAVTLTQSYAPYGETVSSVGSGYSTYQYTGEARDASGLTYLRARYYAPQNGRFISRDTWPGDYTRPLSFNQWNYVEGNPINRQDPSGRSPLWCGVPFIGCVDTASNAVIAAKIAYSKVGANLRSLSNGNNRFNCLDLSWSKPERAVDLLADYFCERGPELMVFEGTDTLTIELAKSILLDEVRKEFYANGDISVPRERKFNIPEFGLALLDGFDVKTGTISSFPLTHLLGSFDYKVVQDSSGRVEFQIDNRTDLASGTHIPLRYPPDSERNNPLSLEQVIQENPDMKNMGVLDVLTTYPEIVSILSPRTRQETGFLMGGGNMYQTFRWSEQLDCSFQKLPWPVYLPFLDIQNIGGGK